MPTHYMYMVISTADTKDEVEALEAKANSLGLGPLTVSKDIARETDKSHLKPFRRRHYGYKLYLEARPHDTVVRASILRVHRLGAQPEAVGAGGGSRHHH